MVSLSTVLIGVVGAAEVAILSVLGGTHLPLFDAGFRDCHSAIVWCPPSEDQDLPEVASLPLPRSEVRGFQGPPPAGTATGQANDHSDADQTIDADVPQGDATIAPGEASSDAGGTVPAPSATASPTAPKIPGQFIPISFGGVLTLSLRCRKGPTAARESTAGGTPPSGGNGDAEGAPGASPCWSHAHQH